MNTAEAGTDNSDHQTAGYTARMGWYTESPGTSFDDVFDAHCNCLLLCNV